MLMKKFTLVVIGLLIANVGFAQRQFSDRIAPNRPASFAKVNEVNAKKRSAKVGPVMKTADENTLMMPRHEEEWLFISEWEKGGDFSYAYDARGNKTSETYNDGIVANKTEHTYDSYDNLTSILESYSEGGAPFEYTTKRLISYDSKVKNVIVESQSFEWDETDWVMVPDGYTYKRAINRDEKGNVTGVEISTYFNDAYDLLQKSTVTYGDDELPSTWKYEELIYLESGELQMTEIYALSDMEWISTDGQILVMEEVNEFFSGNNKLKKATLYVQGQEAGYIGGEYQENGDYSYYVVYLGAPMEKEIYSFAVIDENGSYKDSCVAYKDLNGDGEFAEDELDYSDEINVTYDNAGRVTEEVYSVFDVISSAARYEYTYSPDYGNYPVEQVYYYYDVQNSEYVPYMKLIADDFYDVCAGIDEINVDNSSACAIYNLQGIKINSLEQDLPSGVYIIKQNGKTVKVAK